eukprot:gene10107-18765_t
MGNWVEDIVEGENAEGLFNCLKDILEKDEMPWTKLSPNRQKSLMEFQKFVEVDVHKILKPCQTRWLLVVTCVKRILGQWPALELFFVAEVAEANSPQAERVLQLPDAPLWPQVFKGAANVTDNGSEDSESENEFNENNNEQKNQEDEQPQFRYPFIELLSPESTKGDLGIFIIFMAFLPSSLWLSVRVKRLLLYDQLVSYEGKLLKRAVITAFAADLPSTTVLPWDPRFLKKAHDLTVGQEILTLTELFCDILTMLYPNLMSAISADELYEEFTDYQTLNDNDFEARAWEEARVSEGVIDVLWSYIADMKIPGSNAKRFKFLPKLAEIILIIPHSNAELERLFSIVKKNKSLERSSMKLGGTLSSILAMKTMYPESNTPCYSWKPTEEVLESSKKATNKYNEEHK